MSVDEMHKMAEQCLVTMQAMGGTMDLHGEAASKGMGGMGMGGMGMGGMGSMMGAPGGLLLVLLLLLVAGVTLLVVFLARPNSGVQALDGGPLDRLDDRYARGEVDRETYLQMRTDLVDTR